jgi:hypothetical protein
MGFSGTDLFRQQRGMIRIDIAAIVLLLMVLTIVLFNHFSQ